MNILLIEDHAGVAAATMYSLRSLFDNKFKLPLQITHAATAVQAETQLQSHEFDLVVSDNNLGDNQPLGSQLFLLHREKYAYRWILNTADPFRVHPLVGMDICDKMNGDMLARHIESKLTVTA